MLGSIVSSSHSTLSAAQALAITHTCLDLALNASDIQIASFFCDQTEVSLSQAKKAFKKARSAESAKDQALRDQIARAYTQRSEVLKTLGQDDKAQTSLKKAEKWGYVPVSSLSAHASRSSSDSGSIRGIFLPPAMALAIPSLSASSLPQHNAGQNVAPLSQSIFP